MATQITRTVSVTEDTRIKLPLRIQMILLMAVASAGAAWALTRRDVNDLAVRATVVETKQQADHDLLVEIHTDVRTMLRERERGR